MHTKRQLYDNWESQIGLFGGSGQPQQSFETFAEGYGLTAEKFTDKPLVLRNSSFEYSGLLIGKITINPETTDVKITPNQQEGEANT